MVDIATIREAVAAAGAGLKPDGTPAEFGFPWREDGLYLQQDLSEYSEFVTYMANEHKGASLGIDIGVASGGQTKFLRDYFPVAETIIVDIGLHHEFPHWQKIRNQVATRIVLEKIGDSHSRAVYDALAPYVGRVDFAFIDGDHSFSGLMSDIRLVKEICRPGTLFVLHDTTSVWGCQMAFERLRQSADFELLKNFDRKYGIAVFRCKTPSSRTPYWQHQLAALWWRFQERRARRQRRRTR